jgi:hypothetical protein
MSPESHFETGLADWCCRRYTLWAVVICVDSIPII